MKRWIGILALILVALTVTIGVVAAQENGRVRVIHASPDAPAVDVLVDGDAVFSKLAFGKASDYAELPPGTYTIQIVPAGETEPVVLEAKLTIVGGEDVLVAAVGMMDDIAALTIDEEATAPAEGKAHVRFIHTSPDAPAVDVAVAGGPVLFKNIAFKDSSAYLPVDAGTVGLEVRPTGTEDIALAVPSVTLEAGKVYTVVADGLAEGMPALRANLIVDSLRPAVTAATSEQAKEMPAQLPKTGATDSLPLALLGLAAIAFVLGTSIKLAGATTRGSR